MDLQPLLYYPTGARIASGVVGTLLCVLITFVLMTMADDARPLLLRHERNAFLIESPSGLERGRSVKTW
ncbi:hypothetical protein KDH83_12795 [Achromobacter sp. Marseille-Q0513]|uniref:hypothetical protein n=1 Tax=Achromobacter sp. Marseille-Q0513 TaxID=2829161 RepID=UPI001B9298C8|nr:hypothetical protein [Achromobacter sp. Marseille-Q0513]MBR8654171.1 hypothetical protein [Achromobacter sp. Marseille-Q0513]